MEHNKAPDLDGFTAEFYHACWDIIKNDLMALFMDFHLGNLPLYSLNFGTIIIILKCREALMIQQYRLNCLLNVSLNRVMEVGKKVISLTQTSFLPGQNIMEGVIVLHETIHEMHRKKQDRVILKIDFKRGYDKVNWSFVQQTL
jgi:hypothetical protein